jgi:uncharacterized membrane protein YhaH (DUF805 family)
MAINPYAAPQADVRDVSTGEYQEITLWSPRGRIGRLRYLAYSTAPAFLAGVVAGALAPTGVAGLVVGAAIYVAAVVFTIIAAIKRSHDMDWSGWTVLLIFIPLVGLIWVFKSGTAGSNRFGSPPPPNTTAVKVLALLFPLLLVIGMVAAIIIPAYQDYIGRAQGLQ